MATYNVNVSQSSLFFPDTISGSQSTTFAIGNNGLAQSYFVLETVPLYTTSTPKNTSGSFTLGSGLSGLIQNDYFTSVVVNPGGGNLTFVPAIPVTGSTLMMKGMGSRNDALQAQSIVTNFTTAVRAAGGEITGSEYTALLDLTSDLISYNLLPKMKAAYPIVSSQRNLASYTEASTVGYTVQNVSLTSTTQASPISTDTAVRITYITPGNPFCYQTHTLPANTQYVFSVYLRAISGTPTVLLNINHSNGGGDVTNKLITLSTTWQRYELTFNTAAFSNNFFTVIKNISADLEFWGWQLELGSTPTAYQRTLGLANDVFKNSFKFNLVNPAQFSGSFTSGWTFSPTGMTPNGTSAYMDTGLNLLSNYSTSFNNHFSVYYRTAGALGEKIGAFGTTYENGMSAHFQQNGNLYYNDNMGRTVISSTASAVAFHISSLLSTTSMKLYRNNTLLGSGNANPLSIYPSLNFYFGCANGNGTPGQYSSREAAFASIGNGLSDTDAFLLYLAVQRYQTALNRQV
jgi:hypothetical protein